MAMPMHKQSSTHSSAAMANFVKATLSRHSNKGYNPVKEIKPALQKFNSASMQVSFTP